MKQFIKQITPPVIWNLFKGMGRLSLITSTPVKKNKGTPDSSSQDLDVYWDPHMAEILDSWGKDHVWNEIEMYLIGKKGKVLDIACGTGITMGILSKQENLQIYGCDISDFLIEKAAKRGIDKKYLDVCDATNMNIYRDDQFEYSFSIGSLEHFTEEGILKFVSEVNRTTKHMTFHMMPVSLSGKNEGWIKTLQSYHNNSTDWWIEKFKTKYTDVYVINSGWKDNISFGKWFICSK
jgi:ubiquinone/menaquinone biosynthesis C-methylase UbiE